MSSNNPQTRVYKKEQVFNYAKDKGGQLIFKDGRKLKLRKLIDSTAYVLLQMHIGTHKSNREALIFAYNEKGMDGVRQIYVELINYHLNKKEELEKELITVTQ